MHIQRAICEFEDSEEDGTVERKYCKLAIRNRKSRRIVLVYFFLDFFEVSLS